MGSKSWLYTLQIFLTLALWLREQPLVIIMVTILNVIKVLIFIVVVMSSCSSLYHHGPIPSSSSLQIPLLFSSSSSSTQLFWSIILPTRGHPRGKLYLTQITTSCFSQMVHLQLMNTRHFCICLNVKLLWMAVYQISLHLYCTFPPFFLQVYKQWGGNGGDAGTYFSQSSHYICSCIVSFISCNILLQCIAFNMLSNLRQIVSYLYWISANYIGL